VDGDKTQPTPGEWAIMAGGLVLLLGSFLEFGGDESAFFGKGLFPVATLMPLYGLAMGLQVALTKFANVNLPERILGFTWEQIHLVLGIFVALMALFWLVAVEDGGIGVFVELLGAAAACAGAFMIQKERATGAIG